MSDRNSLPGQIRRDIRDEVKRARQSSSVKDTPASYPMPMPAAGAGPDAPFDIQQVDDAIETHNDNAASHPIIPRVYFPADIVARLALDANPGDEAIQLDDGSEYVFWGSDSQWHQRKASGGGVSDHGLLTGLGDDDHSQYHTNERGDARYSQLGHDHDSRYYTESETDTLLTGKAAAVHNHDDRYLTEEETGTAISAAINGLIDSAPGTLDTLNELANALGDDPNFAGTITTALAGKAASDHNHDGRYYTEEEIGATTDSASGADKVGATTVEGLTGNTVQALIESAATAIAGKAAAVHTHDDRYYTEAEMDILLSGKAASDHTHTGVYSPVGHNHDSSYYTKTQINATDDGSAGADLVGATAITGVSGATVQSQMESLKSLIDSAQWGGPNAMLRFIEAPDLYADGGAVSGWAGYYPIVILPTGGGQSYFVIRTYIPQGATALGVSLHCSLPADPITDYNTVRLIVRGTLLEEAGISYTQVDRDVTIPIASYSNKLAYLPIPSIDLATFGFSAGHCAAIYVQRDHGHANDTYGYGVNVWRVALTFTS